MAEPGGNASVSSGQVLATKDKEKTRTYISKLFEFSLCELDPRLLEAYVDGLTHTLDWMKELEDNSELMFKEYAAFPFVEGAESMIYGGFHGAVTGGPRLMQANRNAVEKKRNIEVWLSSPAKHLLFNSELGVLGAVVEKNGKPLNVKARKSVVLATGGYEYDDELKMNFNLGSPVYALDCPGNTGDGLLWPGTRRGVSRWKAVRDCVEYAACPDIRPSRHFVRATRRNTSWSISWAIASPMKSASSTTSASSPSTITRDSL